jgi:hypothetical protein
MMPQLRASLMIVIDDTSLGNNNSYSTGVTHDDLHMIIIDCL